MEERIEVTRFSVKRWNWNMMRLRKAKRCEWVVWEQIYNDTVTHWMAPQTFIICFLSGEWVCWWSDCLLCGRGDDNCFPYSFVFCFRLVLNGVLNGEQLQLTQSQTLRGNFNQTHKSRWWYDLNQDINPAFVGWQSNFVKALSYFKCIESFANISAIVLQARFCCIRSHFTYLQLF